MSVENVVLLLHCLLLNLYVLLRAFSLISGWNYSSAYMESTAACAGPYELQLAKNWTPEVAPADDTQGVWAAAVGYPALQYSSVVDIFGSSSSLQQLLPVVEYNCYNYYAAAAQHHDPAGKGTTTTTHEEDLSSFDEKEMERYMNNPKQLFHERREQFENAYDADFIKKKMHRYPPSIRALDDAGLYTVPRVVAIGPYHHGGGHLQQAEDVKHAAACHCIMKSDRSVEEMYGAVISALTDCNARGLYHTEVMEDLGDDCFLPMMFFDACFLVMYILKKSSTDFDAKLYDFFESNGADIAHDIMLLENQIPLQVVDAVMNMCCTADKPSWEIMKMFIAMWQKDGFLHDRAFRELPRVDWDQDYYNEAPHLLGLVRFYAVGRRKRSGVPKVTLSDLEKMESVILVGAVELAKIGIFLTGNETTELADIGLDSKCIAFAELSMAPLSLNDARASWLINMAALELCTTPDFFDSKAGFEDSGVCSYLLLLCMMMHREEDVHELRANGILQGGAGLTNQKTLEFFTGLQSLLRQGRCYYLVMVEIQNYRNKRPWIKCYAFCYRYRKTIAWAASAIGGFIGIIIALVGLKGGH